jgi:hypothetical protein
VQKLLLNIPLTALIIGIEVASYLGEERFRAEN